MNRAFLFPGQASQHVGMGEDLYKRYELATDRYELAQNVTGIDLKKICFEGPEDELKQTTITQPAIFVHSVIVYELLKTKSILPAAVAGHSLGEYSALVAAGAINFEDGLKLVHLRGKLMQESGNKRPGTMAAIIGLSQEQVGDLCRKFDGKGIIQEANFNSPGQIAISGDAETVRNAIPMAKDMGAKKAVELDVSGAFHSPLMQDAQEKFKQALEQAVFKDAIIPVYTNVEANPTTDREKIKKLLYQQLTKPVLWQQSVEAMINDGFDQFYEIGPGKVLKGLLKRINRSVPCQNIGKVEEIEQSGDMT
ncbi:MAG: ACP S-malonyltransferase [Caldithrix sp.]|nr:ACP S-malonyltransferase [Caldithrix sp.]